MSGVVSKEFGMSRNSLLILTSALVVSACGHYSPPETFESKMARYQVKHDGAGVVPKIEAVEFRPTRSRAPASVIQDSNAEDVAFSNKKLYFITLYRQYNELAAYSSSSSDKTIDQCPSFHSALVDHAVPKQNKVEWAAKYDGQSINNDQYSRYFPELYLSMDTSSPTPRALDLARKDSQKTSSYVQKAVDQHVDKTYAELAELCEYGTSDNYYAFENLHTEIRKKSVAQANSQGMGILLKTTVFSNKAVLESLKKHKAASRMPASTGLQVDYEFEVMKRLGVPWAKSYYQAIHQGP
tara:strand:+ start:22860 stop:23750 length:891 start_codon:yes stop_codon:yes gene_type:complete